MPICFEIYTLHNKSNYLNVISVEVEKCPFSSQTYIFLAFGFRISALFFSFFFDQILSDFNFFEKFPGERERRWGRGSMARRMRDLEKAKLQDQNVSLSQQAHRLGSTLDAHLRFSQRASSARAKVAERLVSTEEELRAAVAERRAAEEAQGAAERAGAGTCRWSGRERP